MGLPEAKVGAAVKPLSKKALALKAKTDAEIAAKNQALVRDIVCRLLQESIHSLRKLEDERFAVLTSMHIEERRKHEDQKQFRDTLRLEGDNWATLIGLRRNAIQTCASESDVKTIRHASGVWRRIIMRWTDNSMPIEEWLETATRLIETCMVANMWRCI